MAKAYSLDLRQRVFDLLTKGKSKLFIEETLGVATKTILKWQKRYQETGVMERIIPKVTRPRKVDYKKVEKFIEENPDKTLKEIGDKFKISAFATHKIVRKLNITYKKTLPIRGKTGRFERRISKSSKPNS
jgi:putative transposase